MANDIRYGFYAAVVYPDSAPSNWRELLNGLHIDWIESPLHNLDQVRPHWHILGSLINVDPDKFDEFLISINASTSQKVYNQKAFIYDCCHIGCPDQVRYPINQIVFHGDYDFDCILHLLPIKEFVVYG